MSGLWLHIRNSPIRWAFPVLVVLDVAVLFLRNRYWIGDWPETGAAAQVPAYLLGTVGAGAAAWAASASTRQGVEEQLRAARVHPARVEAYRIAATLFVLLVPYLIGQAVAFAVTARTFPPGLHLWLGYVALGLFAILLAVALGWACGRLLGPVFSAFTAALGFLFLTVGLGRFEFIVVSGRPEVAVDPMPMALRLGLVVALLLIMLWLPGSGAPRQRRRSVAALLPVALSLLLVMGATAAVADREPPGDDAICLDGSMRLCIWPEHEKYLPQLREINARIDELPDSFIRPPLIIEAGLHKKQFIVINGKEYLNYADDPPFFYVLEGSPWSYAGDIGSAITSKTFGFQDLRACDWMKIIEPDQARLAAISKWMETYLVGGGRPDYHTSASQESQQAWAKGRAVAADPSRANQFRWAEGEVSDLRGRYCQPRN
ncbi:hypothetical protein [Micromonospora sp. RTGN7]|uniref:hypothetical protein n=1 Tax=Micromonospora sp. RTGN7 TaxID=3016526 RepID=UPI0029FEE303|nr:hypothetical protein [Micromonospora sp. RTGN7]